MAGVRECVGLQLLRRLVVSHLKVVSIVIVDHIELQDHFLQSGHFTGLPCSSHSFFSADLVCFCLDHLEGKE